MNLGTRFEIERLNRMHLELKYNVTEKDTWEHDKYR